MADISEARITVTEEAFQTALSQFTNCKDKLTIAYLQEISAVFTLDSSWNGDASETFKARFLELQEKLKTSDQTMEKAINDLQAALNIYSETESEASSLLESMTDTTDPFAEG